MKPSRIETASTNVLHFVRRLQDAEEHVRRRWLYGLTTGSMILVISMWVMFFNLTTGVMRPASPAPSVAATAQPPIQSGIAAVFAAGLSTTVGELRSLLGSVTSPLRETTDITIECGEQNFILETLPPVPPTQLP